MPKILLLVILAGTFLTPAAQALQPPFSASQCHGVDIHGVYEAHRSQAVSCYRPKWRQAQLYKRYGSRQAAPPGHSRHEAGCACDFHTRINNGGIGRWLSNGHGHTGNHLSDTGH